MLVLILLVGYGNVLIMINPKNIILSDGTSLSQSIKQHKYWCRYSYGDFTTDAMNLFKESINNANMKRLELRSIFVSDSQLEGVSFAYSDLEQAKFRNINSRGISFYYSDLSYSKFENVNLYGCLFTHANLYNIRLIDCTIDWTSHDIVAELLRQEANGDIEKIKIAGAVLLSRHKCWKDLMKVAKQEDYEWALEVLSKYATESNPLPVNKWLPPDQIEEDNIPF